MNVFADRVFVMKSTKLKHVMSQSANKYKSISKQ